MHACIHHIIVNVKSVCPDSDLEQSNYDIDKNQYYELMHAQPVLARLHSNYFADV